MPKPCERAASGSIFDELNQDVSKILLCKLHTNCKMYNSNSIAFSHLAGGCHHVHVSCQAVEVVLLTCVCVCV